eukprot:gene28929-32122_t
MLQTGSLPMSDLLAASCTSAACRMSSLPSLDHVVQSEGECSQQLPPEYKLESPLESPQLCAAPKRKSGDPSAGDEAFEIGSAAPLTSLNTGQATAGLGCPQHICHLQGHLLPRPPPPPSKGPRLHPGSPRPR